MRMRSWSDIRNMFLKVEVMGVYPEGHRAAAGKPNWSKQQVLSGRHSILLKTSMSANIQKWRDGTQNSGYFFFKNTWLGSDGPGFWPENWSWSWVQKIKALQSQDFALPTPTVVRREKDTRKGRKNWGAYVAAAPTHQTHISGLPLHCWVSPDTQSGVCRTSLPSCDLPSCCPPGPCRCLSGPLCHSTSFSLAGTLCGLLTWLLVELTLVASYVWNHSAVIFLKSI